jgi:hypothetical protein
VPDGPTPANGRRDVPVSEVLDNASFWAQNAQKISFLKRARENVTEPRLRHGIKMAIQIAEATVVSPQRGQFARYYQDAADGVWAAKKPEDEPIKVYDLKGRIIHVDNPRYKKVGIREWVNEHDSWRSTTLKFKETPLGDLNKHAWLESRVFSLDLEILSAKKHLRQVRAPLSSWVAPSKGVALIAKKFNPQAAEFVPSVESSPMARSQLNAAAPEFVPSVESSPTARSKMNAAAPEFVPSVESSPTARSKLSAAASEFVPSTSAVKRKLNVLAPEFVPHH